MSYSRWGRRGSGNWYTFWEYPMDGVTEDKDNAVFQIMGVQSFTAEQLRDDLPACLKIVKELDPLGDTEELTIYIREFLADVDEEYNKGRKEDK